jgi:creatinine amidohydrolase
MRTRILNKMMNREVEEYLNRGGDTIFIAVGTVELHGDLPLDCETVGVEAVAMKMAEAADGLALINLPYFFPGATPIGRGTVNMSIEDGIVYLKKIARSLFKQGFRHQIYLTGHGPAYLTVSSVVTDLFDELKAPMLHIDLVKAMGEAAKNGWEGGMGSYNDIIFGAYQLFGQKEYLTVDPNAPVKEKKEFIMPGSPGYVAPTEGIAFSYELMKLAHAPGAYGFYYYEFSDHGGGEAFRSIEERDKACEKGVEVLEKFVKAFDPQKYVDILKRLDTYTQEVILPKFPHLSR